MIVLHPIFDTFPGLVWIQDITGRLVWCNDTWQRFTGTKEHPYYLDCFYPDDRDRLVMAVIECTRVAGWTTLYARMRAGDGAYPWVLVQLGCHVVSPDEPAQWIGIAIEAGPARRIVDAGVQRGKAIAATLEAAHMGMWDWDLITDGIEGSPYFFELLGLDKDTPALGRNNFMLFVPEDDRTALSQSMDRAVVELGDFQHQFRIEKQDGEQRWVWAAGKMTAGIASGGLHMVGILYDVTARVIREHNKDRFIGIASHELRTPIASIKGYTQLLKRHIGGVPDGDESLLLDRLAVQADRLSELTRILLDTTRISGDQLNLDRVWLDLRDLVGQCVDAVRTANIHGAIHYDNGYTGPVYADAERMRQVCTNLLSNAVKFSEPESPIHVRTWREENAAVCFSVRDHGKGIAESMLDKIFEPFVQVPGETQPAKTGLGLGLYISAAIVRQHGGTIRVESRQGEGSIFCVSLPAGSDAPDAPLQAAINVV